MRKRVETFTENFTSVKLSLKTTFQRAALKRKSMAFVSSDQFCLVTTKLRKTGQLSDGQIILDDGSVFKIHKILLATGSGYFNKLFSYHKDHKDFHLKELVSKEAMEQILSWMYSQKLELHENNLPDVLMKKPFFWTALKWLTSAKTSC